MVSKKKKPADKAGIALLALKRPDRPAANEKPVKDEVLSLPATEEPVSDDATFPLPLPKKPSSGVANSTVAVQESVVLPESATEDTVITEVTEDIKPNSLNDNLPNVDLVPKSNNDPLIGTFIEVLAPWGGKVSVEIVDTYFAPSGSKWVRFNAINEIPDGWIWEGGVKLINSITI